MNRNTFSTEQAMHAGLCVSLPGVRFGSQVSASLRLVSKGARKVLRGGGLIQNCKALFCL